MDTESGDRPGSCNDCIHYYITHDANARYGCRAFGFKSQRSPLIEVIEASGEPCYSFQKKERVLKPK
jgi:hypothetical protein